MAVLYLAGKPGQTPKDNAVNSFATTAASLEVMEGSEQIELWNMLSYRQRLEVVTARLVNVLDLDPFPEMRQWDLSSWLKEEGLDRDKFNHRFKAAFYAVIRYSGYDEGYTWSKPSYYLAAACMKKGLSVSEVEELVSRAKKFIKMGTLKAHDIVLGMESRRRTNSRLVTLGRTIRSKFRSKSLRKSLADAGLGV
jgi:hypothetical protein